MEKLTDCFTQKAEVEILKSREAHLIDPKICHQFSCFFVLQEVEKQAQELLENALGKHLSILFSISVMAIPSSFKEKIDQTDD